MVLSICKFKLTKKKLESLHLLGGIIDLSVNASKVAIYYLRVLLQLESLIFFSEVSKVR